MKNSIFLKLLATFGAVIILFSIVLGSVFILLFRNHTRDINRGAMEQKAVSIADTLSSFQHGGMGGYGAYMRFLDELVMAEVWIVDKNLNIFAHGPGKHSVSYSALPENADDIVQAVFSGKTTYGEAFSGLLGVNALTVGAPIWLEDKVIGAVLVHSPVSGITSAVTQGLTVVVVSCGIALLVAGILAAFLSYRFTEPLSRMKNTAIALSHGDYEAQTHVVSHDEIGQLAKVLDILSLQLKDAAAQREHLDKMRDSFVANVSHELRTPVAVLRGSLELLRDGMINHPDEVSEFYNQMLSESKHLERLINDLLELSRLQDVGFHLQMHEVNLCDIVKDAIRAIWPTAQSKKITIETTLPENECIINGDYVRLRQLLMILLDNAVKFSYESGNIAVSLACGNECTITVTDHGCGIAPEDIPLVFDRFHKSNVKGNNGGTGLGLAIAGEIVKRHNGKIHVESGEGHTVFQAVINNQ